MKRLGYGGRGGGKGKAVGRGIVGSKLDLYVKNSNIDTSANAATKAEQRRGRSYDQTIQHQVVLGEGSQDDPDQ